MNDKIDVKIEQPTLKIEIAGGAGSGGGGGGGSITVSDSTGTPSVTSVTEIQFTGGVVTDEGAGVAKVDLTKAIFLHMGA